MPSRLPALCDVAGAFGSGWLPHTAPGHTCSRGFRAAARPSPFPSITPSLPGAFAICYRSPYREGNNNGNTARCRRLLRLIRRPRNGRSSAPGLEPREKRGEIGFWEAQRERVNSDKTSFAGFLGLGRSVWSGVRSGKAGFAQSYPNSYVYDDRESRIKR